MVSPSTKTSLSESSAITKYWMALSSIRGLGPKTVRVLLSRFGSPEVILSAPAIEIARLPRLNFQLAREITGVKKRLTGFEKFIERMSEAGIHVLCPDSPEYPYLLKTTENFPFILYKKGGELPKEEMTVAMVGTRFPTQSGLEAAERIAEWLAGRGLVVVSGLARGIDTAAHRGALKAGGKTLAVLGCGLKMVYPRENHQLAHDICVNGAVLSECHPNEVVSGQRLMQRNRIISGLSSGVILIEPKRGALNTAERALRQNRHIFVYNGNDGSVLPGSLSEAAIIIHGLDELDTVTDRLPTSRNEGIQMHLL